MIRRRSTHTLLTSISDVRVGIPVSGRVLGYGNIRIDSASGEASRHGGNHGGGIRREEDGTVEPHLSGLKRERSRIT
ncbi:MAG: hypothetical protein AB7N70_15175 [Dehalococcoidia bacterium]